MTRFGLTEDDLQSIISILRQEDSVNKAVVFGSRAIGNYKRGSDVDIALGEDLNRQILSSLSYKLNEETFMPYRFDLVNLNTITNEKLLAHIDRVGVPLFSR